MIITLSPSKSQDFEQAAPTETYTVPEQLEDSKVLIKQLQKLSQQEISQLMSISENLSALNYQRFHKFKMPFNQQNAKQALFAFKGDVYSGINTASMDEADYKYAQQHLRILSGLYGCLRPLDLIQPYRLEMKTKLKTAHADNLYKFWGERITESLNQALENQKHKVIVNLASNEYWKSVKPKLLKGSVINVAFKENKDGKSRIIAIFAKKARGMMSDFIIRNRIEKPEDIKQFNYEGYKFDAKHSTESQYVFSRKQPKPVSK
jgi:hypothetical protein